MQRINRNALSIVWLLHNIVRLLTEIYSREQKQSQFWQLNRQNIDGKKWNNRWRLLFILFFVLLFIKKTSSASFCATNNNKVDGEKKEKIGYLFVGFYIVFFFFYHQRDYNFPSFSRFCFTIHIVQINKKKEKNSPFWIGVYDGFFLFHWDFFRIRVLIFKKIK